MVISNMYVCRESYDFCTKILINFEICVIDRLMSIEIGGLLLSIFINILNIHFAYQRCSCCSVYCYINQIAYFSAVFGEYHHFVLRRPSVEFVSRTL